MKNGLPELTHLQFMAIKVARHRCCRGSTLRKFLSKSGVSMSLAAFYQLMRRMENEELLKGEYVMSSKRKLTIRERFYSATPEGEKKLIESRKFYQ